MSVLRDYQQKLIDGIFASWNAGNRNVAVVLPTGGGKCLGRDTPVMMFDGSVRSVQDVRVFDILMGPDSSPRIVTSVCSGREPLYRITPTRGGDPYIVNESHILSLKMTNGDRCTLPSGEIAEPKSTVNISVKDYLISSKTFRHCAKGWRTGVDFPNPSVLDGDLPPYLLGLWLAEGTSRNQSITTAEPEVRAYLIEYARQRGFTVRVEQGRSCETIHVNAGSKGLLGALRRCGVISNKHVPHTYKTASRNDRLDLLAGYLDGDGYLNKSGYDAVVKQKSLAEDIAFVARSLGFSVHIAKCRKGIKERNFEADYFRLSISGDMTVLPVIVPRRRAEPRRQIKNHLVTGIKVEPIGEGEYFGFELSGPDRLFLLGDFTVTHNTVTMSHLIRTVNVPSAAIAHRQELVSQISLAMAGTGIVHRIVAPDVMVRFIVGQHVKRFGRSFYHANAPVAVAGIDTLLRRAEALLQWRSSVQLWDIDECHHVLRANKWGKGVGLFPNARGVGFTATLTRADRKALGSHKGGVFDDMVLGPGVKELIALGHLARFRMFGPRPSYTMSDSDIGAGGDYSLEKLRQASHDSPITGDIVEHYLKITPGKLGITFVVDVETAVQTAAAFNAKGVPAAAVSAKTTDEARQSFLDQFQRGDIKQLVNVDLFGEGFDVPGVEVVSMGRKTMSLGLYRQQAGRMMRPAPGKTHGFLIDHVQNVIVHGPPDRVVAWSLDEPERKARVKGDDEIPVRTCTACHESYEVLGPTCPFCGHREEPASRSEPAFVDGDLFEYDEALMARLRGEIDNEGFCPIPRGASEMVAKGIQNRHDEKLAARGELRECIALWAGIQRDVFGRSDSESYRRFYHRFGIDVLSAQTLNRADTEKLTALIRSTFS